MTVLATRNYPVLQKKSNGAIARLCISICILHSKVFKDPVKPLPAEHRTPFAKGLLIAYIFQGQKVEAAQPYYVLLDKTIKTLTKANFILMFLCLFLH